MTKLKDLSGNEMKQVSLSQKHYPSQKLADLINVIEPMNDRLLLREIPDEPINQTIILKETDMKGLLPYVRALVIKVSDNLKEKFEVGDVVYYRAEAMAVNFPNWNATKDQSNFYVIQYGHSIEYKIPKSKVVSIQ